MNEGELIQVINAEGEDIALLRVVSASCPEDHLEQVCKDYRECLDEGDEENATFLLFRWGLKRIFVNKIITV